VLSTTYLKLHKLYLFCCIKVRHQLLTKFGVRENVVRCPIRQHGIFAPFLFKIYLTAVTFLFIYKTFIQKKRKSERTRCVSHKCKIMPLKSVNIMLSFIRGVKIMLLSLLLGCVKLSTPFTSEVSLKFGDGIFSVSHYNRDH